MREINEKGLELVKSFEGFRASPYLDIAGYLTCGYGHFIRPGEDFSQGITEQQALELLEWDLRRAEQGVSRLIAVPLTDNQYASLVSFTFNLGGGALQRSSLRAKINRREYQDAANEFPKWVYAGGFKSKGLLRRRLAERELFLS